MINLAETGFTNAPCTRLLITWSVLLTLLGSILSTHHILTITLDPFTPPNLHRLLTHSLPFSTPGEFLFGITLLHHFRDLERQLSPSKFLPLLLFATTISTTLMALVTALTNFLPAPGPYPAIIASLFLYILDTPTIYTFTLFGVFPLNDKFFVYLLSIQFILANAPKSFISGGCSLVTVLLYRLIRGMEWMQIPSTWFQVGDVARLLSFGGMAEGTEVEELLRPAEDESTPQAPVVDQEESPT